MKHRLVTLAIFLLLGAIVNVAVGCSSIPRASEPIPVAQYLSERTVGESDDATLVKVAPIAIRLEERIGRICIDIVVEGPPWPALNVANHLVGAVGDSPEDWLEILKPNGKRLKVVPFPRSGWGGCGGGDARGFSVPLSDSMIRMLAQACAETPLLEQVPAGIYRVRLLKEQEDAWFRRRTPYMMDTEWHDFEIFRGRIRGASLEQMPRVFVPRWLRVGNMFFRRYGRDQPTIDGSMLSSDSSSGGVTWPALLAYKRVASARDRGIAIYFTPRPQPKQPMMQLRCAWLRKFPDGRLVPTDGSPIILCNLSADEAEAVVEHGIPASLVDVLLQAARQAGWPETGPIGSKRTDEVIEIPAESHFRSIDLKQ